VIPPNVLGDVKDRAIFEFDIIPGVHLLSVEQRRSWHFDIFQGPGRGYRVELFSFHVTLGEEIELFPKHKQRWGVQLYHPQWETLFAENQNLDIGACANWAAAEWQFFPPDAEGVKDYLDVEGMEFEPGTGYQNMLNAVEVVEKVIKNEANLPRPLLRVVN
jgi:hypothetical protein